MKNGEQQLTELKESYDLLIQTVHDMNDLIHELRDENQELKELIEELQK